MIRHANPQTDQMRLLVWRGGKYLLISATVPRRTWEFRMQNYVPPAATR